MSKLKLKHDVFREKTNNKSHLLILRIYDMYFIEL